MSKNNYTFRHFDEWSKQFKRFGENVSLTGVYFKHGQRLCVQRMVGHVTMDFTTTLPDGQTLTSPVRQFATWNAEGKCTIKGKRCPLYDVFKEEN